MTTPPSPREVEALAVAEETGRLITQTTALLERLPQEATAQEPFPPA